MEKIKVAIRTRPLMEREEQEEGRSNWRILSNTIYQLNGVGKPLPNTSYSFDYIFEQTAPTSLLYDELIAPIVSSVVEGFNGTVFAYGQTSSGKTFTMMGAPELPGIIPFTFSGIFKHIEQSNNCEFVLRLSYMEIYNETIMDLLNPSNINLTIRESNERIPYVANLTEAHITDFQSIDSCLYNGEKNRHFGRTNMNDRSSRSHTLLRLILESKQFDEGSIKVSHLNLIDLAGSERASATTGDGLRFKEGTFINRSLLTLGTVIRRLSEAKKDSHIPYRDSKLTRILESSLGGNAKTVIICTVTTASVEETHSTLRFASRAKSVENHAIVNEYSDDSDVDTMLKRLKKLEKENLDLKKRISEDVSCRSQLQDMESKISSLKSMVIRSNNITVVADQATVARRYTMGALPSSRAPGFSKLLEREQPPLSPNLDLARIMMNRSDGRRRGGKFEPIKIQFDQILEEKESPVLKEDHSLGSRTSDLSVDYERMSPLTPYYVSADNTNSTDLSPSRSQHSLAETLCAPEYVPVRKELVSSSTQTDIESFPGTENIALVETGRETVSVSMQTEFVIESSCTPVVQDVPIETVHNSISENKTNSSILIQTEYLETTVLLENSSVSIQTEENEIFYSSSLPTQSLQPDTHIDAHSICTALVPERENYAPIPVVTHDSSTITDTYIPLHQSNTADNNSISVQTEDADTSQLTHRVTAVDTASSPLSDATHSAPTQFPEREYYPTISNTSMQTDYIYKMSQDVSMQTEQEHSTSLHSVECWIQTDTSDVVTSDISRAQTDAAKLVAAVKRQSISVQTVSDDCKADQLSPVYSFENITQSLTEIEIAEILNEPSSLPIESSESSLANRFDNFIVQTTNSCAQTENVQDYSSATVTDSAKVHTNDDSTQTEFIITTDRETEIMATNTNLDVFERSEMSNEIHNESMIFSLSEKVCQVEASNEELILELELYSISNNALKQTQNKLKDILINIVNQDTIETSNQLIDSMEPSEISSLLATLLGKISSHRDEEQLKEATASPEEAIEEIKLMVNNWSEADVQQLPHYLLTVKTEIERLNTIIESNDSSISELKAQLDTVSYQQPKSVVNEEILVELEHIKSNNKLLEAQLSNSESKIEEYASLLSLQEETDTAAATVSHTVSTSVMTDDTAVFSEEERTLIDDKLIEINNINNMIGSRRRVGVDFITLKPFVTLVGFSNIIPFLDKISEVLNLYLNDLDVLIETNEQVEQHKDAYVSVKEDNSRLRTGIEHLQNQFDSEKINKQKAQLSMNSAMDEITDLFKANDMLEQQIKQSEEEAEKRRIVWHKEQSLIEDKLQEANMIIEEKELVIYQANSVTRELRDELASVHNHYSDYLERDQVQTTVNRVVELERDTSSLQKDNQNLMATRSQLESNIMHLQTQLEMDRLERNSLKQEHARQLEQLEEELSQLSAQNLQIDGLNEKIKSLEVCLRDSREEADINRINCQKNQEEFKELLEAFRALKKEHLYHTDELFPEMSNDMNNLEAENKALKESLSTSKTDLTEVLSKLKCYETGDSGNHIPDDKLTVSQLHSKCNYQQRRIIFLEDQCRNIERRRQLEVSAMPKHDFLSLRADRASLKAQARGSSKAPLMHRDSHSVGDVPLETANCQPNNEVPSKCNNQ